MADELHMIQLELEVPALMRVAYDHGWTRDRNVRRRWDDLGYLVHHQLAALFQELAPQPFRIPRQPRGRWLEVLGYTSADGDALRRRAEELAKPSDLAACRLDGLRSKPMPPSLFETGRCLGFEVRTCPVVRLSSEITATWLGKPETFRKGAEIDVFLRDRYLRGEEDIRREDVYRAWLTQRLHGVRLLPDTRLHAFRRVRLLRRGRRRDGERSVTVPERPDALFTGTVEVTEPDAFASLLARGVGRHRAFGFGMLLLRPPGTGGR